MRGTPAPGPSPSGPPARPHARHSPPRPAAPARPPGGPAAPAPPARAAWAAGLRASPRASPGSFLILLFVRLEVLAVAVHSLEHPRITLRRDLQHLDPLGQVVQLDALAAKL